MQFFYKVYMKFVTNRLPVSYVSAIVIPIIFMLQWRHPSKDICEF